MLSVNGKELDNESKFEYQDQGEKIELHLVDQLLKRRDDEHVHPDSREAVKR